MASKEQLLSALRNAHDAGDEEAAGRFAQMIQGLPQESTNEAGKKSLGLIEAGAGMVAGLPSQIAGGLVGLGSVMSGQGIDEAIRKQQAVQESNFGFGAFKPKTEEGKKYSEALGEGMDKVLKAPGKVIGQFSPAGQLASDVFMEAGANFLPLPVGVKGMRVGRNAIGKAMEGKPVSSRDVQTSIDDLLSRKAADKAMEIQPLPEVPPVQGPTLPNRGEVGNARTQVQNPATAQLKPMERMAADLGATPEVIPGEGSPAMSRMADDLSNPTSPGTRAADQVMADRQAAMEMEVRQKTALEQAAAERARQETAPIPEDIAGQQAEAARLAAESEKMQNMHQVEIDDTPHVLPDSGELYGKQYGTGDGIGRVDENGMPIRADRSLEAQQLENPLQRNLWGDELKDTGLTGKDRPLTEALDRLQHSDFKGDLRDQALSMLGDQRAMNNMKSQRGHANEDLVKSIAAATKWFTASPEHGRTKGYTLEEQAARSNANEQRYGPGQYIAENRDFSSTYGGPEGRMYEVQEPFNNAFNIDQPGRQKTYDNLVKLKGSKAEANKALAAAGYDAVTFTSPRGDKLANIFNAADLKDVGPAREKLKQVAMDDLKLLDYEPGVDRTGLYKRQGGVIKVDGTKENAVNAMRRIAGFAANMRNIMPEQLTTQQFIDKYKGAKDIVQNAAQKASNQFTKGGIYLAERFDNPLYSRTVDQFIQAEGRAKAAINEFVNEDYTPKLRALSKQEMTDTWMALRKFEAAGVRPTQAELASANLNAKQRAAIDSHWNLMDNIFPKINETLTRLGMDTISPEAAYVATKATGTFRQPVYKGEKLVGYVGSDSRAGLAADVKKYLALDPAYRAGPETAMNTRGKSISMDGIQDTLNWLKNNDPDVGAFLAHTKELMDSEAFKYRGSNTHTMSKSGIEGMPGNKPWEDAATNAKDGFEAQVAYAKRMFEWAEKAKAVEATKDLIASPELDMPVAKEKATEYMNSALGQNPTIAGRAIDDAFAAINVASGGKARHVGVAGQAARAFAYAKFLKADLGFLYTQLVQAPFVMPEMGAFLSARGSGGNMLTALAKAYMKDDIGKGALKYARDNHVYASDLIGHSDSVRKDASHYWDSTTNYAASKIEAATREAMFLTLVRKMYDGGLTPEKGLYATGARLTDMAMGNYSRSESPRVYQQMGAAGTMPYTLATFKHNELSRLAMLARETKNGSVRPLITALASQVAKGGILGTVGFKATEEAVEYLTGLLGDKPLNLTKWMLDNGDKKIVPGVSMKNAAYGVHSYGNVDLSGRIGMGEIMPTGADIVMPGMSALIQGGKDIGELASDPSVYNAKKAMVDILPGGRHMEGFFFDKPIEGSENTRGINRNKVEMSVERTPTESLMKKFGVTSVNENAQKALSFQNGKQDMWMKDKQNSAVLGMKKDLMENGTIDQKYFDKYFKYEGTENGLRSAIQEMVPAQNLPANLRDLIRVQKDANKISRRFN